MSLQPNMAAAVEKETKVLTTPISWEVGMILILMGLVVLFGLQYRWMCMCMVTPAQMMRPDIG